MAGAAYRTFAPGRVWAVEVRPGSSMAVYVAEDGWMIMQEYSSSNGAT